uniref:BACK domain-containing protein n=1 Tax=Panagrellus redivivus TaxID=6233 RepID=A0A7E4W2X1_PANRE
MDALVGSSEPSQQPLLLVRHLETVRPTFRPGGGRGWHFCWYPPVCRDRDPVVRVRRGLNETKRTLIRATFLEIHRILHLHTFKTINSCTSLEKSIYCIGGTSEGEVLRDCERYNLDTNEWNLIAPMQVARYQAATATWRGLIIAIGGSEKWSVLDSVEAYDPKTDTWRFLAKLKTPRRGCAVAVVRDSLYVIGGHDGNSSLASVEILDSPTGNWRYGPSLLTPRANTHAVVTAGNVIYAIGGYNANQFLSSIELLECESVGWRNWQQESTIHEDDEIITDEGIADSLVKPAVAVL